MKALIYTRVSSEEQSRDGHGLDRQLRDCEALAEREGYKVAGVYTDAGVSGTVRNRPELMKLMADAAAGKADVVLAWQMDRFGRRGSIAMRTKEDLDDMGVRVMTVKEGDTPFGLDIGTVVAAHDYDVLLTKSWAGKLDSLADGNVLIQTAPLGYDRAKANGLWTVVVNEQEAKVVRAIYDAYMGSNTLAAIAADLTDRVVPTKIDRLAERDAKDGTEWHKRKGLGVGRWAAETIRTILRNEMYTGSFYYRKTQTFYVGEDGVERPKRRYADDKKRSKPRPRSEWIGPIPVPEIVTLAEWKQVQGMLDTSKARYSRPKRPPGKQYVLRGRCTCGKCGRLVYVKKDRDKAYYHCPGRLDETDPCSLVYFNSSKLEPVVLRHVLNLLAAPGQLEEYMQVRATEAAKSSAGKQLAALVGKLAKAQGKVDRLVELYTDGELDRASYDAKQAKAKAALAGLVAKQEALQAEAQAVEYDPKEVEQLWADTLARLERTVGDRQRWERLLAIMDDPGADPIELQDAVHLFERAGYSKFDINELAVDLVNSLDIRCTLDSNGKKHKLVTITGQLVGSATVENPTGSTGKPTNASRGNSWWFPILM